MEEDEYNDIFGVTVLNIHNNVYYCLFYFVDISNH